MQIVFKAPGPNAPDWLLANVELVFSPDDELSGLKLIGVTVRKGKTGKGDWIALPSRKGNDDKYYDYLTSAIKGYKPVFALKDSILKAFDVWLKSGGDETVDTSRSADEDDLVPF